MEGEQEGRGGGRGRRRGGGSIITRIPYLGYGERTHSKYVYTYVCVSMHKMYEHIHQMYEQIHVYAKAYMHMHTYT